MSDPTQPPDRDRRSEPEGEPFPVDGTPFDVALWQVRHKHDGTPRRAFCGGTDPE
ncbi:hypothetical protein [Glycomyces salinus]|uniref:hypothetical protein n=1 Tax=Glycomyces salinus TaxID=980294 RepID=UPI0018EB832E|nr:hypothetical protein [Glycomyces salinus]